MSAMDRILGGSRGGGDGAAAVRGTARTDAGKAAAGARQAPAGAGVGDGARAAADASLLALVDRLAGVLDRSALAELEVGAGGTTLTLRKVDGTPMTAVASVDAAAGRPAGEPAPRRTHAAAGAAPAVAAPHGAPAGPPAHAVAAPLTGIYYASPSPTAPPFVTVGQEIVAGQVIGLIEAMKLFNEIKSDASGRISRIAVENGKLVKAKQTLIEVVPL